MLYFLLEYLYNTFDLPGARLYTYISFRAGVGMVVALLIGLIWGKKIILQLRKKLVGETIRDLGLSGQMEKSGTPTMGGIIIVLCILITTLLIADLRSTYVWLLIISTVWCGTLGFLDDYIKVFRKNKQGLKGKFKVIGQVGLGIIVGTTLYLHSGFVYREMNPQSLEKTQQVTLSDGGNLRTISLSAKEHGTKTTIPFFKKNEFDYKSIFPSDWKYQQFAGWILFILVAIFIITAVSNGSNLTDGIDGLAAGTSVIIGVTLGIFAYVSSNISLAHYLNILYIPNSSEIVVFMAIFVGALIAFLWYNFFPAQVFMGDTGSLALGGIIATCAILIRKELMIPVLCGIFFVESVSVIIQRYYFKYSRWRCGTGKRVFLMAPLHHHFQKKGYHEAKIVFRFYIVALILAVLTVLTLKIR